MGQPAGTSGAGKSQQPPMLNGTQGASPVTGSASSATLNPTTPTQYNNSNATNTSYQGWLNSTLGSSAPNYSNAGGSAYQNTPNPIAPSTDTSAMAQPMYQTISGKPVTPPAMGGTGTGKGGTPPAAGAAGGKSGKGGTPPGAGGPGGAPVTSDPASILGGLLNRGEAAAGGGLPADTRTTTPAANTGTGGRMLYSGQTAPAGTLSAADQQANADYNTRYGGQGSGQAPLNPTNADFASLLGVSSALGGGQGAGSLYDRLVNSDQYKSMFPGGAASGATNNQLATATTAGGGAIARQLAMGMDPNQIVQNFNQQNGPNGQISLADVQRMQGLMQQYGVQPGSVGSGVQMG